MKTRDPDLASPQVTASNPTIVSATTRRPLLAISLNQPKPAVLGKRKSSKAENIPSNPKTVPVSTAKTRKNVPGNEDEKFFDVIELLSGGNGLENINSVYVQKVCLKIFGDKIEIPDVKYFLTTILEKSKKDFFRKLFLQDLYSFLYVYETSIEEKIFAISIAVTMQHQFIYLNSTIFDKAGSTELSDESKQRLEHFCDEVIEKLFEKYSKKAKFVMYNSNTLLSDKGLKNTQLEYFRISCFSHFFRRLKFDIEKKWQVNPRQIREDLVTMRNYYSTLNILNTQMIKSKATLAEGVQVFLNFLVKYHKTLEVSIVDIVLDTITAAPLGANYLDPTYKGKLTMRFANLPLRILMEEFIDKMCPVDQFDALGNYKKNLGEFDRIGKIVTNDVVRYWTLAGQHYKGLADLALELAGLPAIMPRLNMQKISSTSIKWSSKPEVEAYALTLIANDSFF